MSPIFTIFGPEPVQAAQETPGGATHMPPTPPTRKRARAERPPGLNFCFSMDVTDRTGRVCMAFRNTVTHKADVRELLELWYERSCELLGEDAEELDAGSDAEPHAGPHAGPHAEPHAEPHAATPGPTPRRQA